MTKEGIHEFGISLLLVYLHLQKGNLINVNMNLANGYPPIVVENPKKEFLYVWVKTELYPNIPSVHSIENKEKVFLQVARFCYYAQ